MAAGLKKDDLILNCNRTDVQLAYVPVSISVVFDASIGGGTLVGGGGQFLSSVLH